MNPADVASIGAVVKSLYEAISFRVGEQPDLNRLRSLLAPEARLIHAGQNRTDVMDVETFISRFREQLESGALKEFSEAEASRRSELFGNIAHVFSTYESRFIVNDVAGFARGINSIQLRKDSGRWLVVTILWDDESSDKLIPAEYLPSKVSE